MKRTKGMSEHDLQNLIRVRLSELGYRVFRANVGKVKLPDGRWFDTGLPRGFSDLFAVKNGRVSFIEVKVLPNVASDEQINFISQMLAEGCSAGVAYSVEDAVEIVTTATGGTYGST